MRHLPVAVPYSASKVRHPDIIVEPGDASRATPNLATVTPARDHIDEKFTTVWLRAWLGTL
jgi:hypothetical protein